MSIANTVAPAREAPQAAPRLGTSAGTFQLLWQRYARKAAVPAMLVLAAGLTLLVVRAITYPPARAAGFERGRAVALNELHLRMAQSDSIRHEGELQAIRMLRNVRFFYLGKRSRGACLVKYADASGPNYSTGWVADMRFMEPGKEYALDRNGAVWSQRR